MATWSVNVTGVDSNITEYSLSDKNPFKLLSITGIGNAEIRRLEERGPFQEGVTDIGYRVDARTISLVIQIYGSSASDIDAQRDKLASIFSPIANSPIRLKVARDDGTNRQIDCYAIGMVDLPAEIPSRILNSQRVGVQLKAPNPIWYDPIVNVGTLSGLTSDWYLAGDLISSGNVIAHALAPGSAAAWSGGTIGTATIPNAPWSVVTRGGLDAGDIGGDLHLWSTFTTSGSAYIIATTTSATHFSMRRNDDDGDPVDTYAVPYSTFAGTPLLSFVSDGSNLRIYSGTALINSMPENGQHLHSPVRKWRDGWTAEVTHAAAYNVALSVGQIAGLLNSIAENPSSIEGVVDNEGNWDEYPIISVLGPIDDPVIINVSTGDTLDFTGSTVGAEQSLIIDTRYGYKTATLNGANVINALSDDSDLATFRLRPGNNYITCSASGTAGTVTVQYYDRFLSS